MQPIIDRSPPIDSANRANLPPTAPSSRRRGLRLLVTTATLAFVWLVVLPRLATWGPVRQLIERNRREGINADAMFYTEIGEVEGIRLRQEAGTVVRQRFLVGSKD